MIVSGAQDGLSKTLETIIGPGDPLLVHDPFYPGVEVVVGNSSLLSTLIAISFSSDCPLALNDPRRRGTEGFQYNEKIVAPTTPLSHIIASTLP